MLFESSRVKLRKMTKEDTELYHKWRNDVEVMHSTSPSLDVYHKVYLEMVNGMTSFIWVFCKMNTSRNKQRMNN